MKKLLLALAATLTITSNAHALDFYMGGDADNFELFLANNIGETNWGWRANFLFPTEDHTNTHAGNQDMLNSISATYDILSGNTIEIILNGGISVEDKNGQQEAFDYTSTDTSETLYGTVFGGTVHWYAWEHVSLTASYQKYSRRDEATLTGGITVHF